LLGHEIAHFVRRHSLREHRTKQNGVEGYQAAAMVLAIAAGAFTGDPNAADLVLRLGGSVGDVVARAQVAGYSRDLEREADELAFLAMRRSGYDAYASIELFKLLEEEAGDDIKEPFLFGSHPYLEERIAAMRDMLTAAGGSNDGAPRRPKADPEFNQLLADIRLLDAALDLKIGRVEQARREIELHLEFDPGSPEGLLALGEFHRRYDRDPGALDRAMAAYRAALTSDPNRGAGYREIGLIELDRSHCDLARANLRRYLDLEPAARDRPIVELYIDTCASPGGNE
jgi:tetratricopeptide (TPR) repeat protein